MPLKDFHETFDDELTDRVFAVGYLEVALEENGLQGFLAALRNIVRANGGVAKIAESAGLGRESLYKALSKDGNPQLSTVASVLNALGLQVGVKLVPERESKEPQAA